MIDTSAGKPKASGEAEQASKPSETSAPVKQRVNRELASIGVKLNDSETKAALLGPTRLMNIKGAKAAAKEATGKSAN